MARAVTFARTLSSRSVELARAIVVAGCAAALIGAGPSIPFS